MNFPTSHNVRMTIQNYEFMDHLPSMICPFLGQLSHLGGTDIFMKVMVVTDTRRVWGRVLSSLNIRNYDNIETVYADGDWCDKHKTAEGEFGQL